MTAHVSEHLADLALGLLDDVQRQEVEAHIGTCRRCREEAALTNEALSLVALVIPPVPPPPALRERVLKSVEAASPGRFDRFAERVAKAIDVSIARAKELLAGIDREESWSPAPVATSRFYHIQGGPGLVAAGTITGFVRVEAETKFPHHKHVGEEYVLVLQGGFTDDDGRVYRTGEDTRKAAGTSHAFVALPGEELVYLAVVAVGVEFDAPFEF
jgi:putative transcriptional regulator